MIRFKVNVQKRDEATGRSACVFFVETVTCDDAAAAAVRRAARWARGGEAEESEDSAEEPTWVYLGRDWLLAGAHGLDAEFKAGLRAWLVERAGMGADDEMLVSTWAVGFAALS